MESKPLKARRKTRTPPASSTSPPPSGTPSASASSVLLPFQIDMIRSILAHPDDMMSIGRKSESLYFNLRPSDAPYPPPDFRTGKRWESSVDALYKAAASQPPDALLINIQIQTLAEKFRQLAQPLSEPLNGKRKIAKDESGDEGGFEPAEVCDSEERAFLERMSGRDIPVSTSSGSNAKRPRISIPYVQFDDVRTSEKFEKFIAVLRENMQDYHDGKKQLPEWDPPQSWITSKTGTYQRFTDIVKVPRVPFRATGTPLPDLSLLWLDRSDDLDPGIQERVEEVCGGQPIVHLLGPSGNGKSRILYQIARQTWNILVSCGHDIVQHPYCSADVLAVLRLLNCGSHTIPATHITFEPYVVLNRSIRASHTPSEAEVKRVLEDWGNNELIAYHMFDLVILARLMVLDVFLGVWKPAILTDVDRPVPQRDQSSSEARAEARAMHLWAILQICPTLLDGEDIFESTIQQLFHVHPDSLAHEIKSITQRWRHHHFLIDKLLVDEVQTIASKWETAFGPNVLDTGLPEVASNLPSLARPLLGPFLRRLRTHFPRHSQLIVAGTKLSSTLVDAAILYGSAKPTTTAIAHTAFGGHFSETAVAQLLEKFFGAPASPLTPGGAAGDPVSLMETLSPSLRRDVYFWLPGRCGTGTLSLLAINSYSHIDTGFQWSSLPLCLH
ncbi:hypothetical protein EXIGLDRAFT_176891 [Exidia glandulosa HHB12029]|uniref:Uncharacterized protein n=1 Tax=Exidia glandulosa HHB12029 TaxID=1314781 RepID=A0A165N322_EXIGL|nr:hypothetical protein EXIGLDRAFT_176891 [Exidia glandulosa HHB12029]